MIIAARPHKTACTRDTRDRLRDRPRDRQNPRRYWDVTHVTGSTPARVHVTHAAPATRANSRAYTCTPLSRVSRVSRASVYAGFADARPVTYPVTRAPTLSRLPHKKKKRGEKAA